MMATMIPGHGRRWCTIIGPCPTMTGRFQIIVYHCHSMRFLAIISTSSDHCLEIMHIILVIWNVLLLWHIRLATAKWQNWYCRQEMFAYITKIKPHLESQSIWHTVNMAWQDRRFCECSLIMVTRWMIIGCTSWHLDLSLDVEESLDYGNPRPHVYQGILKAINIKVLTAAWFQHSAWRSVCFDFPL
jgi:hypothetical protein